jgi:hypothetical protein
MRKNEKNAECSYIMRHALNFDGRTKSVGKFGPRCFLVVGHRCPVNVRTKNAEKFKKLHDRATRVGNRDGPRCGQRGEIALHVRRAQVVVLAEQHFRVARDDEEIAGIKNLAR